MKYAYAFVSVGLGLILVITFAALGVGSPFERAEAAGAFRCNDDSLYFPVDGTMGWRYGDPASTDTDAAGSPTAHTGVDVYAKDGAGAVVYAPGAGMVSRQNGPESLNLILTGATNGLTGETGIELYVTHITPSLGIGERFEAGDEIGVMEGDHVHFSVGAFMGFDDRQIDETQDPSPYFGANLTYDAAATERLEASAWCDASISVASITPLPPTPTPTPSPSSTALPAETSTAPVAADLEYVVRPGDTLSGIAESIGASVDALAEANGLVDLDTLEVGQTLIIPGEGADEPGAVGEALDEQAASAPETYVVQEGDTLSSIAETFGVTVDEIVTANDLSDVDFIAIGQELTIGAGGSTGTSPATTVIEPIDTEYVVVDGDTLSSIAEAYGTDIETLQSLNAIEDPSFIAAGDTLLLP